MGVGVTNNKSTIVTDGLTVYYDVGNPRSWSESLVHPRHRALNTLNISLNNTNLFTGVTSNLITEGNLVRNYRIIGGFSTKFVPEDFTPTWNSKSSSTRFINFPNYISLNSNNPYTDYDSNTKTFCASWLVRFDSYPSITPAGYNYPIYYIAGRDTTVGSSTNPFMLRLGRNGGQTTLEYESKFAVNFGPVETQIPFDEFGG